ncbi:MAG: GTPase Era [Clostridia bacterium]|nr:GTPase Era [Clostridia bacterium]MDY4083380.1 GTPase Era [Eubacteriales bacterium]
MKSGFVSVVGKPNVGKSTLINTLVGEKVSIVSWKPQTTRDKILGIVNGDGYQVVLADCPGVHTPKNALSEYMMKSVGSAVDGVDAYIYVLACSKKIDDVDMQYINKFASSGTPLFIVINKCDEVKPEAIGQKIDSLKDLQGVKAIIPVSALSGKNCDLLMKELVEVLPEGVAYYDTDSYTDKTVRFMVGEIVREKALRLLGDEIPYGICVAVNRYEVRDDGLVSIDADIVCEKQAHKSIVIGKGGSMIKKISTMARQDIEKLVDAKVYLNLFVKVKENWRDSASLVGLMGYNIKDI